MDCSSPRVEALPHGVADVGTHTMLPRSAGMRRLGRARRGIDVLKKWRMARLGMRYLPGIAGAQEFAGEAKRFFFRPGGGQRRVFGRREFRRWAPRSPP